jgi:hypothetical protein
MLKLKSTETLNGKKDPHPHTGVLSASQYDLPQYLHIANFYMH